MIEEYICKNINEEIKVKIIHSRRKSMALEIKNCNVIARVPYRISDKYVKTFIEEHKEWIIIHLRKAIERQNNRIVNGSVIIPVNELTEKEIRNIEQSFLCRTKMFAEVMNVTFGRITIRNQKTRWGSCSSKGNLNFNYKLYYMPKELMDYVIVHELSHRVHMNHSEEFWKMVEKYCPNYKECRKNLKNY